MMTTETPTTNTIGEKTRGGFAANSATFKTDWEEFESSQKFAQVKKQTYKLKNESVTGGVCGFKIATPADGTTLEFGKGYIGTSPSVNLF